MQRNKLILSALYLTSIVGVNWIFAHTGPAVGAFCVGAVFVLRDFAQREIGHRVLALMAVACAMSFFMASPTVAIASAAAFAVSETVDWAVFSMVKNSFEMRVLLSSIVGVMVDSLIFLQMIDMFSWQVVFAMWVSKMAVATVVFGWLFAKSVEVPSV